VISGHAAMRRDRARSGATHGVRRPGASRRASADRPDEGSQRYPRSLRLRARRDYLEVQSAGRRVHGRHFLAVVSDGPRCSGRVGITVSKRVGSAVTRNRIKRWVREFVRRSDHERWLPAGRDVVFIAKASAASLVGAGEAAADLARIERMLRS
jgi:ribonuclease P protein component